MASRKTRGKRGQKQKKPSSGERICGYPGCERPYFAREHCAAHYRQLVTRGTLTPIHPYRSRIAGTAKYAGLRLSEGCIEQVDGLARSRGLSRGAALAEILEGWHSEGSKPPPPVSGRAAPQRGQRK